MKKFLLLFLIIGVKSYSQCWNKILLGGEQSFASKTDNTFLVWGRNDFGELGIGVTGLLNSPTQQPININWQQYSIGFSYGLGLKSDFFQKNFWKKFAFFDFLSSKNFSIFLNPMCIC